MLKNRKGQSTLEYIILMTAVVVAIIAFVVSPSSPFKTALNQTLNSGIQTMNGMGPRVGLTFQGNGGAAAVPEPVAVPAVTPPSVATPGPEAGPHK